MTRGFRTPPRLYRPVLKLVHWGALALIVLILLNGLSGPARLGLIVVAVLWALGYVAFGHLARPGPALTGISRSGFNAMHVTVLLSLEAAALAALFTENGPLDGGARVIFLLTLGLGLLHGIFHLWRHTALGDGALRNITPRMMHGIL
jgi:superoxide oxidase